jgi:hypothetical protein
MTHEEDISKKKDPRVLDCGRTRIALRGISDAYDRLIGDYRDLEWDYELSQSNLRKVIKRNMELIMDSEKKNSIDV